MKPDTRKVTELFELDVRYVVPLYQRPYVWEERDQWEPLWSDVLTLLEHQEADNGQHYSHFLGAIVLDQVTQAPGRIPMFTVIDGQQRLTTLQILLAAAASVATQVGASNDAALLRDLVRNNERKAAGVELYKVWPTNANRAAFQAVMADGGPPAGREDDPVNRIDEAYSYFHQVIHDWATETDASEQSRRLELLRITICELLKVVTITLEADDNAQVIFETLNARGTPLLALDLVKNSVFLEAARQNVDTDGLYNDIWRPQLDDDYWRENRRQGRLFRPRGEIFLSYWLTMRLHRLVPATELFTTFRNHVLGAVPSPQMSRLIPELCRDARTMRSFDSLEPGTVGAKFFERLQVLEVFAVMPLVLYLFSEPSVSPVRRERALRMLESWLVRRMLMGATAKNYNQLMPTMIGQIAPESERADELILDLLRSGTADVNIWPDDSTVRRRLQELGIYGWITQGRLAMVLAAIEESLYSSYVEALQVPKGLSIEHILPQSWEENWPAPGHLVGEELQQWEVRRSQHVHLLGNLTLTTLPLNSALSNAAWEDKQRHLNRQSKLLMNSRLIENYPDRFDDACIDERGAYLADQVLSIWPGPDAW
jgi:hypothetical protein